MLLTTIGKLVRRKMRNSFAPNLEVIKIIQNRALYFRIENTDIEGVAISKASLIRFLPNALSDFSADGVLIKALIDKGNLKVSKTHNVKFSSKIREMAWVNQNDFDFIFYLRVSERPFGELEESNDGVPLSIIYGYDKNGITYSQLVEDFKFHINTGAYNNLIADQTYKYNSLDC